MALASLDIHVPPAAFNFLPIFPNSTQQNRWQVYGEGAPFTGGTADDLHPPSLQRQQSPPTTTWYV